jgi:hypothetical protein
LVRREPTRTKNPDRGAAELRRNVDQQKFELQRQGYAAAIADRQVLETIRSSRNGRIAVLFMEWSGSDSQQVVIDWTMIDGAKAAQRFGNRLLKAPRSIVNRTSTSSGIDFAAAHFARAPFASDRRTIDVSGDSTNNAGRTVVQARDAAVGREININGLVILSGRLLPWNPQHTNPLAGLANYYRANVVGGPGCFVLEAEDFHSFAQAIIKKMIAEITHATAPTGKMRRP